MKRRTRRGLRGEMVADGEGSHFSGSAPESQSWLLGKLWDSASATQTLVSSKFRLVGESPQPCVLLQAAVGLGGAAAGGVCFPYRRKKKLFWWLRSYLFRFRLKGVIGVLDFLSPVWFALVSTTRGQYKRFSFSLITLPVERNKTWYGRDKFTREKLHRHKIFALSNKYWSGQTFKIVKTFNPMENVNKNQANQE